MSFPAQARQAASMDFSTGTFDSGVCPWAEVFKPAAQSKLVPWASTQPAPVFQSVVRVQIETKVPLQGKQILNGVGRGRQPPSKLLFKCQNPNQGRNAVSADDKLPRRTGSVSIRAGSEDLC